MKHAMVLASVLAAFLGACEASSDPVEVEQLRNVALERDGDQWQVEDAEGEVRWVDEDALDVEMVASTDLAINASGVAACECATCFCAAGSCSCEHCSGHGCGESVAE